VPIVGTVDEAIGLTFGPCLRVPVREETAAAVYRAQLVDLDGNGFVKSGTIYSRSSEIAPRRLTA
jgi:hypothetical protein